MRNNIHNFLDSFKCFTDLRNSFTSPLSLVLLKPHLFMTNLLLDRSLPLCMRSNILT